jgi:probable F420-dependent oxidoreductase
MTHDPATATPPAPSSARPLKVRFAVSVAPTVVDPRAHVRRAEELGFDSIWLSDLPMMAASDPLVALAALAGATERVHLGVNLVPFGRNPMVLARQLAQIDQLSGGRLLVTMVPGVDQPGERGALGTGRGDRGPHLEEVVGLLRRWWRGESVTHHGDDVAFDDVVVLPRPVQEPLEIWFGGHGPKALDRVGRLGDGWLTAGIDPDTAAVARRRIDEAARAHGRTVDPEHHGISLPYARRAVPDEARRQLERLYPGRRPEDLLPVGAEGLREHLHRYLDGGLSKFVLRAVDPSGDDDEDLRWLADVVLPLQR